MAGVIREVDQYTIHYNRPGRMDNNILIFKTWNTICCKNTLYSITEQGNHISTVGTKNKIKKNQQNFYSPSQSCNAYGFLQRFLADIPVVGVMSPSTGDFRWNHKLCCYKFR